jgi:hypothetical protein
MSEVVYSSPELAMQHPVVCSRIFILNMRGTAMHNDHAMNAAYIVVALVFSHLITSLITSKQGQQRVGFFVVCCRRLKCIQLPH